MLSQISLTLAFIALAGILVLFMFKIESMALILTAMISAAISVISGIVAFYVYVIYKKTRNADRASGAILAIILSLIILFTLPIMINRHIDSSRCHSNLRGIGIALSLYADDFNQYPPVDRWCDSLIEYEDLRKPMFICPEALKKGDKGPCHYAINPQCKPNSPPNTVLLFETKGGWNQYGGSELVSKRHGDNEAFCVVFNDGHVEAVEDPARLNWGTESADK
jgi:hypothetical protein